MPQLLIQPAGGRKARRHYRDTVAKPVPLEFMRPFIGDDDYPVLHSIYAGGSAPVWGVAANNESRWLKILPGDIVLFLGDNRFYASAVITLKTHNPELGARLWPDDDAETWDFIYFIDAVREVDIPYEDFRGAVAHFTYMRFNVLPENIAESYLTIFEPWRTDVRAFRRLTTLRDATEPFERQANARVRLEQSMLRGLLLQEADSPMCGICGRVLPPELLVAAHIKRRADCTRGEKGDPAIAMLMCSLGCDALFENGYVSVVDGRVVSHARAEDTEDLRSVLAELDGRASEYWTPERQKYFRWHQGHQARG